MRVHIEEYPNTHWHTGRIEEWWIEKTHGVEYGFQVKEEDYTRLDRFVMRILSGWQWVLNHTINPLIRNRKRKIEVHIDPHDTWGMDTTLGYIILPMLKQLKATKHGSPWVEDVDVPHLVKNKKTKKTKKSSPNVRAINTDVEDQHSGVHERWNWVLDEMIWAFEQVIDDDRGHTNYYVPYEPSEELERGYFTNSNGEKSYILTEEEAREMGRYDPELHKTYQERVNRGLTLFGKYYQNLWD